jgi:hypothetical protein
MGLSGETAPRGTSCASPAAEFLRHNQRKFASCEWRKNFELSPERPIPAKDNSPFLGEAIVVVPSLRRLVKRARLCRAFGVRCAGRGTPTFFAFPRMETSKLALRKKWVAENPHDAGF